MRRKIGWLFALALMLCSCNLFPSDFKIDIPDPIRTQVDVQVNQALVQALNNGISALQQQPSQWNHVLEDTIKNLNQLSTKTIDKASQNTSALIQQALTGVQNLSTTLLGQAQVVGFCSADFVGRRVSQRLKELGHSLFPNKFDAPTFTPVVCATNPPRQVDAGVTRSVTYYGFDFISLGQNQQASRLLGQNQQASRFEAVIAYANNTIIRRLTSISVTSNYQLTVDIQTLDFHTLDASSGPQLRLIWSNKDIPSANGQSALPIILPLPDSDPAKTP